MSAVSCGDRCKVTVETPGGVITEFEACSVGISYSFPYDEVAESRFEFIVISKPTWNSTDDYIKKSKKLKSNEEWKCDWCGSINDRKQKRCTQCGGARSFIYGL